MEQNVIEILISNVSIIDLKGLWWRALIADVLFFSLDCVFVFFAIRVILMGIKEDLF